MDMSVYHDDFTQHDLFGRFPGAPGGRALRDTYGRVYLVTIATKEGWPDYARTVWEGADARAGLAGR